MPFVMNLSSLTQEQLCLRKYYFDWIKMQNTIFGVLSLCSPKP